MKTLIIILIALLTTSCVECKKEVAAAPAPPPVQYINGLPVAEGFANFYITYHRVPVSILLVKESGMKYITDYRNGVINITKDSLEVVALKQQIFKDSLQIEVSKKYLKN